jgi:hypothetical protein
MAVIIYGPRHVTESVLFHSSRQATQAQTGNSKSLCAKLRCGRRRELQLATNSALVGVRYKNITSTATSVSQTPTIGTVEDLNLVLWKRMFNYDSH